MTSHILCGTKCGMDDSKFKRKHPQKALSVVGIKALNEPGRYADGNGLYLVVDPSGSKRWVLRTVVQGRRRDIGLGGLRIVSLSDARQQAAALRQSARSGGDPLAARRQAKAKIPSFSEAAKLVHRNRAASWKNQKHAAQWLSTLEQYVFPALGSRRIDQIESPDVLRVLSEIWLKKPETARRIRQRIGTVFDWAKAAGLRVGENPVDGVSKGLPRQPDRDDHFAAMAYVDVPKFVTQLHLASAGEGAKLALEFLILTASRTREVLGAEWREIDFEKSIWTIAKGRMKAGREHKVPLSKRAVAILKRAKELAGGSFLVFPGRSAELPMSNMVFLMIVRRMGLAITVHGFRSAFRDWASERTNFSREVCEMALAHTIKSKAEAAYRRGDLLEKRRELMATWAKYIAATSAQVVTLRAG
jgi:integrase